MRPYSSYKDSGVEWIGEIPQSWIKSKIKYESIVPVQYGINTSSESYVDDGIRFIRTTDITDDGKLIKVGVYLEIDSVEDIYKTKKNDILISRSGTLGRTYLHDNEDEMTYGGYLVRFNFGDETKSRFIFYYSKTKNFEDWISLNTIQSTIGNVNGQKYSNLSFPLPPLPEQKQIVTFLDHKTQKIDELIEKTEQKIELLKEKRTSLINHCVTKGLNPNVEMKDSGVEWIGEIPSGWKCGKLNYLTTRIGDGLHSTPSYVDESEYYFVNGNNLKDGKVVMFDNTKCVDESEYNNHFIKLNERTLLLSINGTIGNVSFYNNEKIILGKSVCYIRCSDDVNHKFVYYLIQSDSIQRYFTFELTGTTIFNLSLNSIRKTPISYPELEEQHQIVEYLDEQTQKIDTTIEKETQRIELLKEYRQSIISEVVTGKIDVRDEVVV